MSPLCECGKQQGRSSDNQVDATVDINFG
ncbi:hypothetical protein PSTT_02728 [Puccinia striiformis]|uniref:Uncharacterized protein n=1 Tax=Puccinia striiformis TaxID=27350 RepID=A0A2S4VZ63_9BASI|nr:hypothetical protein PSTT_02727 [Puccinia striiformis]POW14731.1 hypothetical protein PSTT_02728 [Puccinia striiformis]